MPLSSADRAIARDFFNEADRVLRGGERFQSRSQQRGGTPARPTFTDEFSDTGARTLTLDRATQTAFQELLAREGRAEVLSVATEAQLAGSLPTAVAAFQSGFEITSNFSRDLAEAGITTADAGSFGDDPTQAQFETQQGSFLPGTGGQRAPDTQRFIGNNPVTGTNLGILEANRGAQSFPLAGGTPTSTLEGTQRRSGPGAVLTGTPLPFGVTPEAYLAALEAGPIVAGQFDNPVFDADAGTFSFTPPPSVTGEPATVAPAAPSVPGAPQSSTLSSQRTAATVASRLTAPASPGVSSGGRRRGGPGVAFNDLLSERSTIRRGLLGL